MRPFAAVPRVVRASLVLVAVAVPALAAAQALPDAKALMDKHNAAIGGHGGGVEGKNYEDCFVTVRRYHTSLIADLARKLEAVREGEGTMLDNTLIVYLSDSGDGHHPQLFEWPVVMLGNLGGRLKTGGRYLQFPKYQSAQHRTMANLYLTLLHADGQWASCPLFSNEQFGMGGLAGVRG